ncbi:MAG: DUF4835 family protein [Flavobacteriaceae bacterium]|nr:DUF4835 family protein [Bacteroidia bacterium]NND10281.1 DUF4835 family protein [Flavobacteriaceae bacterium]NNK29178.1 DUF4835 family protein [Flavobacteriaceae bacterium]NNL60816.1 DUF4835 family protein [Flavobacteriaceae bacterium]RZV65623.1 MAG: DUF4835 family protein [Flavobacteriaceae bacterium]
MRNLLLIFLFIASATMNSQELNCTVVVNAQQTGDENLPVFKTMERQINEFINKTKWTDKTYLPQERINCSMFITIQDYSSDSFTGTIQVQSSRPVYGSSYGTPVYNYNDKDFSFRYLEFQNMIYNPSQFESNLISMLTFHVYMILGMDADSFAQNGGDEYFKQAQTILQYSQQGSFRGWELQDGQQTRFVLIDNVLSPTYKELRNVMYSYHIGALDLMHENPKLGKEKIANVLKQLEIMNRRRPNSYLLRVFFDSKADEIEQIFSGGPKVNIVEVQEMLNKVAPMHSSKWRNIKF